jgi:hypothetical protein
MAGSMEWDVTGFLKVTLLKIYSGYQQLGASADLLEVSKVLELQKSLR